MESTTMMRMEITPDIHHIINSDDSTRLRNILDKRTESCLEWFDEIGNGLLHLSAALNKLHCVEWLLSNQPSVQINQTNLYGRTPLHLAAFHGSTEALEKMLNVDGVDINITTKAGCTPLYFASCRGHLAVVKKLLEAGANPNIKTKTCSTALVAASVYGSKAIVLCLLDHQADPTVRNSDGMTALHCAAEEGKHEIVEILLSRGCDSQMMDHYGRTPQSFLEEKNVKRINLSIHQTPTKQCRMRPSIPECSTDLVSSNNQIISTGNITSSPSRPTVLSNNTSSPSSHLVEVHGDYSTSSSTVQSPNDLLSEKNEEPLQKKLKEISVNNENVKCENKCSS